MAKLVVSTWSRNSMKQQLGKTFVNRGGWLKDALAATASKITAANYPPSGVIKGIFVAPEYFFSAKWAGLSLNSGRKMPRPIGPDSHDALLRMLIGLSQKYPRILMLPGTVAWKKPIDPAELEKRLQYYDGRAANKPALAGDQLYRALASEYQRSKIDGSVVDGYTRYMYQKTNGSFMPTDAMSPAEFDQIKTSNPILYASMVGIVNANNGLGSAAEAMFTRVSNNSQYLSGTMQNTAYVLLNGRIVHTYSKQGNFHEEVGDRSIVFAPGAKSGIQDIEGMRCGFEICLDHALGTLSRQLREGREIDVQIVMSDWVQYNPGNAVVRDGGYFIHASTNAAMTGVWQIKDHKATKATSLGTDVIASSNLDHYEMDLDFDEPIDLEWLFKKEPEAKQKAKSPAKKWAPVQAPVNPFRGLG